MVSLLDLVKLSEAVYSDHGTYGGWQRTKTWSAFNGFYCSFFTKSGQRPVLSFRGTDGTIDWASNAFIFVGYTPPQYLTAYIVLKQVKNLGFSKFYLTGHSLGGSLAARLAYSNNLPAVTFDAPGMLRTTNLITYLFFSQEGKIIHISSDEDLVSNLTGPHLGTTENVSLPGCIAKQWPDLELVRVPAGSLNPFDWTSYLVLKLGEKEVEALIYIKDKVDYYIGCQHSITNLANEISKYPHLNVDLNLI